MYKTQLQELSQGSGFNLPAYACVREGPDHAPRFKATVTFNGETFESPGFYNTLRHAEHAAAEVALVTLSKRGPSQSLASRVLDETGVCKNLLQETAQRAGVLLPNYSTVRSGPGHMPIFASTVQVAGMSFDGEVAKTKKQSEKNAAMAAWNALKKMAMEDRMSSDSDASEERLQHLIARVLMDRGTKVGIMAKTPPPPQPLVILPSNNPRIRIIPFEGKESTTLPLSGDHQESVHFAAGGISTSGLPERSAVTMGGVINTTIHLADPKTTIQPFVDGKGTIITPVSKNPADIKNTGAAPPTSSCPHMHVRQMVPVCSPPARQSPPELQVINSEEVITGGLDQLKL